MARIRNVKPEFFRHEGLQDLEISHPGQYVMLTFQGLWSLADKEGRFEWKPRHIGLDILPFIQFDRMKTLAILEAAGFIRRYVVGGKPYGLVLEFKTHQRVSGKEAADPPRFPEPPPVKNGGEAPETQPGSNGEALGQQQGALKSEYGVLSTEYGERDSGGEDASASAPAPTSSPASSSKSKTDPELIAFATAWNALPRDQRGPDVKIDSPPKSTLDAWKRRNANPELRRLSADVPAVMKAVAEAVYCHGKGWFTFAWMFAKGSSGELNLEKITNGNFRDSARLSAAGQSAGSGATRVRDPDAEATAALLQSRKKVVDAGAANP